MTAMDVMNVTPQLLAALWTTSWQAGVMAGAVWLACRQWPRMPANLRVMLWWLVSLRFVIGLVWTQPIPLPVLPASVASAENVVATRIARVARVAAGADGRIDPAGNRADLPAAGVSSASRPGSASYGDGFVAAAVARWLPGLWLLGVLVQGALLLRQLLRTRRLIAASHPVDGDAAELFDDLVIRLEVGASQPRLRVSTTIGTPQVTGLTRPVILLPVGALESFSTRELSLTLCHELMHVKRLDLWHGWIPSVAARLFFFHPLARLAAREYAIARETACDARVLAFMGAPAYDYGRLLMRLGIAAREAAPAAAGASPTLHTLKRRLLMLHDASPHARGLSPRWWALAAIAALLVIPLRPTAAQPPSPSPQGPSSSADEHAAAHQANPTNQPDHGIHHSPQSPQRPQRPQGHQGSQSPQDRQSPQSPRHDENRHADSRHDDDAEPWVFVPDDNNAVLHGNAFDLAYAKRLRHASEPLIWFKHGGRGYVIRDARTIDNAQALFIRQEETRKAARELEERQMILRAQQDHLGQQQDALREQSRDVERKVDEAAAATRQTVAPPPRPSEDHRRMVVEELRLRETRLRDAEANRRGVAAREETLAMQQRALAEQQGAVGNEQAALGRLMEELSRGTEREMRSLFDRALAAGKATPVK